MNKILLALVITGALAACGTAPHQSASNVTADDPDLEEAQSDLEESKADYESCVREQEEYEGMDCEPFKEIYEEDREAYEQLKAKRARR